ncbi:class I SAM-dependent methyltransferase [Endozoicomonas atrinae]|uniref:class I SAM-dependent methyltransferase n=1 Tax=Endozoicomonas atrinae TaxID=1333660 RepID=UPI001112EFD2|nr:class I SAM-dependent methyltransferase [Endozoicomonas atrinae]
MTQPLHSRNTPDTSVQGRNTEVSNTSGHQLRMNGNVSKATAATPEQSTQESPLAWFRSQQGKSIEKPEQAQQLLEPQKQIAQEALALLDHIDAPEASTLSTWVHQFHYYHHKISNTPLETKTEVFVKEQSDFYCRVHESSELTEEQKLGFEFLLGLVRFQIAAEIDLKFAIFLRDKCELTEFQHLGLEEMEEQVHSETRFFKRLARASEASEKAIDVITKVFGTEKPQQSYWQAAKDFYAENTELERLAKALISIHYEPENTGFLGIAQHLHWNGFGGDGKYLTHEKLKAMKNQAFNYHGNQTANASCPHFTQRLEIFGRGLKELMTFASKATTNALTACQDSAVTTDSENRTAHHQDRTFYIYDLCTGPKFAAVATTAAALQQQGHKVALTLSDVDGSNLKALVDRKNKAADGLIEDVRYEDLNLPLEPPESDLDKYDLVSASLGLHQLPDHRQKSCIQHFTRVAKPGGFISIPHVNELAHTQLMLIPANIVDRESFVPDEILLNFAELAVRHGTGGSFKVPYPLRGVTTHSPENSDKENLYGYTMYVVVELTGEQLSGLQEHWDQAEYSQANQLISSCTNIDIDELEQQIYKGAAETSPQ